MSRWTLAFWTPGNAPPNDGATLGCASLGMCTQTEWIEPGSPAHVHWPQPIEGTVLRGTYTEVLAKLPSGKKPSFGIAFFTTGIGMEDFLAKFRVRLPGVPLIGGAAARAAGKTTGEVLPLTTDVALLLADSGNFVLASANFHKPVGLRCEFEPRGARCIERIRMALSGEWRNAVLFYREIQRRFGVAENDFDSIAFTDKTGRNIHSSLVGGCLRTGANLPIDHYLTLSVAERAAVMKDMSSFFAMENAVVFACAALRGFTNRAVYCGPGTVASFVFGELCPLPSGPAFGNLMLARIRKTRTQSGIDGPPPEPDK